MELRETEIHTERYCKVLRQGIQEKTIDDTEKNDSDEIFI